MSVNWDIVAKAGESWDTVTLINADGSVTELDDYAPRVYFDETSGTFLETSDARYSVTEFHPSEFLTAGNYRYHLSTWTDDNEPVAFYLTEITDLDDPEALVGWALVTIDQS